MEAPAVLLLNSGIESRYLKSDKKMAGLKNNMKKKIYFMTNNTTSIGSKV